MKNSNVCVKTFSIIAHPLHYGIVAEMWDIHIKFA